MFQIECVESFDFLSREYVSLFASSRATAFQRGPWLDCFYRHMPSARGAEPLIVLLRDHAEVLHGVVPLIVRRKSGIRLIDFADLGVTDYAAPVLSPELEKTLFNDETLGREFRAALPVHDILRIRPVREEHTSLWQLLVGTTGTDLDFGAYATDLGEDYGEWRRASLDRSLAKQIDRKRRKFAREQAIRLRRLDDAAEIDAAIAAMANLRKDRFEDDPIQQDHALSFYSEVAVEGARDGFAETFVLTSDQGDIGYLFGLTHRNRFHYLLIGCDYQNWGKFSPGLIMYDDIIEDWMRRGGTVFDFTIGGEDFKMKFGAQPTKMAVHLARGSVVGGLAKSVAARRIMGTGAMVEGETA